MELLLVVRWYFQGKSNRKSYIALNINILTKSTNMKTLCFSLCLTLALLPRLWANNVILENISLNDQQIAAHKCNIMFDISWENSWRTSTTVPTNWDACWVFAKYRVSGGNWHHCTLSTVAGDFTSPAGCTITPSNDGKGVFIYRTDDGSGNNDWNQLKLPWKYGLDGVNDDAEVEVKLFAIEMVYIPEGSFYIGDGNGVQEAQSAFHSGASNSPVQITTGMVPDIRVDMGGGYDDPTLINTGIGIDGDGGIDPDNNGTIDNALFPTGFKAFYIMKYETSQEQYMEFLNLLTRTQQQNRVQTDISGTSVTNVFVMSNTVNPTDANGIRCATTIPAAPEPVLFFCDISNNGIQESCDGQCNACNKLSWSDVCAYCDWTGLRPMTELEYEKTTRGPNNPVLGEYAWGNTNLATGMSAMNNINCPDSWVVLIPDEHTGRAFYYSMSLSGMPRCGICASSSINHTRQEAGAAYYGAMEMSGAASEPVVTLGNVAGRSYQGTHGDGEVNANGDGNTDYWPGINGNNMPWVASGPYGGTTGITDAAGSGLKGGSASTFAWALQISDRYFASMGYPNSRQLYQGARFVRSAP
jgi:formylglycine-generating enzyme required for sulfatase activity